MHIGIEARWITLHRTGFGKYALNLLREIGRADNTNNYVVYLNQDYDDSLFQHRNFLKCVIKRRPEVYKHLSIPWDVVWNRRRFDFFHFLYNAPSLYVPCPYILTVHDVSFKRVPDMLCKKDHISISLQFELKLRRAKRIIAVSKNTKHDIVSFYGIPSEQIEVIHEGVEEQFVPVLDNRAREMVRAKYNLPERFVLYVGTYLPHKNLNTLLRAYSALNQSGEFRHSLVLAGKKGRNSANVLSFAKDLGIESAVHAIGFVEDDDLPCLYSMSDLFVFPSLYEGFGLPILEAMACGVPVISSLTSSLPEIGGDAALYFAPYDSERLAAQIRDVLLSESLRKDLSERGVKRAGLFSWARMAQKTLELYKAVYAEL